MLIAAAAMACLELLSLLRFLGTAQHDVMAFSTGSATNIHMPVWRQLFSTQPRKQKTNVQRGIQVPLRQVSLNAYNIERVNNKKRALDVQVFRNFSISPMELIGRQQKESSPDDVMTEEEAIDHLMPDYDSLGKCLKHASPHDHPVYFVAVNDDKSLAEKFAPQNGVIGCISTQLRERESPMTFDLLEGRNVSLPLPERLPPHIYIANMLVDDTMRRRGIGIALLSAVADYVRVEQSVDLIALDVETKNLSAIRTYERAGYGYMSKNGDCAVMYLQVPADR